jgi:hypothetical protein
MSTLTIRLPGIRKIIFGRWRRLAMCSGRWRYWIVWTPMTAGDHRMGRRRTGEAVRALGYEPVDRELVKLGYDIESRIPGSNRSSGNRISG